MPSGALQKDQLIIPAVTEDDLRAFHASHFVSSASDPTSPHTHNLTESYEFDFDDGLGYYQDGMKRTLTDEQIALFRHSEIQSLLRDKRHRQESEEDEAFEASGELASAEKSQQTPSEEPTKEVKARPRAKKARARQYKLSTKALHIAADDPQGRTHRRMARELDNIEEETLDLDY